MRRSTSKLALALALVPLSVTAALWVRQGSGLPAPAEASSSELRVASFPSPDSEVAGWYASAAEAFRGGDLGLVRASLTELAGSRPDEAGRARVAQGLYEYSSGDLRQAIATLTPLAGMAPELEDWRLFAVADGAARLGQQTAAAEALAALLDRHQSSPLRGRALLTAVEQTWRAGNSAQALALLSRGRQAGLSGEIATELEVLAWEIASAEGDQQARHEAARRLLVSSPMTTWRLNITDLFRDDRGRIDSWEGVLTAEEVMQRSEAWMAAGRPLHAQRSLETVASGDRDTRWEVLMAQALTEQGKGAEAYRRLRPVRARNAEELALLEWQRAVAAADQAVARRGRANLPASERNKLLQASQRHLRRVVELGASTPVSIKAVREIYSAIAEQGRFDESMKLLGLLRQLDPHDRTGAAFLWERGWQEFQRRNYTGAIGYFTHLEQLYPDDRESHRGRYWKARALEGLGDSRRAQQAFRAVVQTADTADFYVRQAALRLDGEQPVHTPGSLAPRWPEDPRLERVLLLADLGLTPLARQELDLLTQWDVGAGSRDLVALRGILTVREGKPRQGVIALRAAFPALGGPYQSTVPQPVLEAYYPLPHAEVIRHHADAAGLPVSLVAGIIRQESAFDSRAESWAGARGLMQLMPATAREMAGKLGEAYSPARLFNPDFSIQLGSHYFRYVLDRFDGNVELALAGYNGGPNRIRRLWIEAGRPEARDLDLFVETLVIRESQDYVKRILVLADSYRQIYGEGEGAPAAQQNRAPGRRQRGA
jgi:soluble lytic murein transglycosylase-like protein